jgi:hypothetical protein
LHTSAVFRPRRGDKTIAESEPRPIDSISFDEVREASAGLLRSNQLLSADAGSQGAIG